MSETSLTLHSRFAVGEVDPRIFGGFLEHMGRAVYEGVYDPASPHADEAGRRSDVLDALRGLEFTCMRYPGGNFVSGYHWEDGVGPRDQRPTVRELAWGTIETNDFGTDEFCALARDLGWAPMLTVNLGTGTPEEARNWVEYTNGPPGTKYADRRVAHGCREPYGVPLWFLGNEMDGPWQLGHVPASEYAVRAQQAAKLMRSIDREIELVVCGSSGTEMPTWLEWDREVLEYVGGLANYVSTHRYIGNRSDDTDDYLAIGNAIDRQIEELDAVCRYAAGKRRSSRRAYISFDEWNVWYKTANREGMDPKGQHPPHLIEEVYNLEDALAAAAFLHSFVRHADSVKIANLAQIVNVIAPILTRGDELLVQSIYYPFQMFARRRTGMALKPVVEGPGYRGEQHGEVTTIDASAILDGNRLHVFATNRSSQSDALLRVELADRAITALAGAELLTGPDAKAANTYDKPDVIRCERFDAVKIERGIARTALPPLSLAALTFEL